MNLGYDRNKSLSHNRIMRSNEPMGPARRTNGLLMALIVCVFTGLALGTEPRLRSDVWLDVDPANGIGEVDDGLMMIQVFHSPELAVRGVSVVFGNAPHDRALPIAQDLVGRFGPKGLKVYSGASSRDDLGRETDATKALAAALRERQMTILAVGPVTNVATLLQLHPELNDHITRIIMVAGRRPGQRFAVSGETLSDFNFEHDPDAMQLILDSGVPLDFAPWELSSKVWINRTDLAALARCGPTGEWIERTTRSWIERWEKKIGPWGFNPFDSLAAGWTTHPELIQSFPATARIVRRSETSTDSNRIATKTNHVVLELDQSTGNSAHKIRYGYRPDPQFKGVLLRRLAGAPDSTHRADALLAKQSVVLKHLQWDKLVKRCVTSGGWVDYDCVKNEAALLDGYLSSLGQVELGLLGRDEELALLINAHNAFVLRLLIELDTPSSVKKVIQGDYWTAKRWSVGGRIVSLDDLVNRWIRPQFGEPRSHFALVRGAVGCAPLRAEAYTGERIDAQFADQVRYVHAHQTWCRFDGVNRLAMLTPIYEWYGQDFQTESANIVRYAAQHGKAPWTETDHGTPIRIVWQDYDWRLNCIQNQQER